MRKRFFSICFSTFSIIVIIALAIPNLSGFGQVVGEDISMPDESDNRPANVPDDIGTNQIIIKYNDSGPQNRDEAASTTNINRLSDAASVSLTYFREMSGDAHVLRLPNRMDTAEVENIAAQLSTLPEVAYAEPDYIMFPATTPNDPRYPEQWHYFDPVSGSYGINMPPVWDTAGSLPSVVVAVIDTGILFNHADMVGQTVDGYDFIHHPLVANDGTDGRDPDASDPGDWITPEENASGPFEGCQVTDSSWHGTHVAGTIAAASNNNTGVAGINWTAKILPVRVLGKCGGFTSDIADGMLWAAGLSVPEIPDNPNPSKILNLSLGGKASCPTTYQTAINDINATGASIIVAAGNSNQNVTDFTPANCNGVITVAATGKSGEKAGYSNFGSRIDLSAPGGHMAKDGPAGGVLSTSNTGTKGPAADAYLFYNGTSMAAPHVSGVVSMMYALDPELTSPQVLQILQDTVTSFPSGSTCNTDNCGSGILNAYNAIQEVDPSDPPEPPDPDPTPTPTPQPEPPDPDAFTKINPADSATDRSLTPLLSWSSAPDATAYEYCIDTTDNDTCDGEWIDVGEKQAVTLSAGLNANTTYYWQVRATTDAEPGDKALFNGNFDQGYGIGWTEFSSNGYQLVMEFGSDWAHSGDFLAWMGGVPDADETARIYQSVTIPTDKPFLHFYYDIYSDVVDCDQDTFEVKVGNTVVKTYNLCEAENTDQWTHGMVDLSAYKGTTVTLMFEVKTFATDDFTWSDLFLDTVSLESSAQATVAEPILTTGLPVLAKQVLAPQANDTYTYANDGAWWSFTTGGGKGLSIAVTTKGWDDIGAILTDLGYPWTEIPDEDLTDYSNISQYDVIFANCNWNAANIAPDAVDALQQFVENGGSLYASDYAYAYVNEAFPGFINFYDPAYVGNVGHVTADIVDSGLATYLDPVTPPATMELEFDLGGWVPIDSVSDTTTVYLRGDIDTTAGEFTDKPLTASFIPYGAGSGKVIYTAFHNEAQLTDFQAKFLEYMVLVPTTSHVTSDLEEKVLAEGVDIKQSNLNTINQGQTSPRFNYNLSSQGKLVFGIGFNTTKSALTLIVYQPDGKPYVTVQVNTPPFIVTIENAAPGQWQYQVIGADVPYGNYPYATVIGDAAGESINNIYLPLFQK